MELILDTCTFLWIISDPDKLSPKATAICSDISNKIYLSSVSCWEIALKQSLGKLDLKSDLNNFISQQRINHAIDSLDLDEKSALYLNKIPKIHKDPFDRMLVCQAICNNLAIITPDKLIKNYDVEVIW